jgi:hypothetical protein
MSQNEQDMSKDQEDVVHNAQSIAQDEEKG